MPEKQTTSEQETNWEYNSEDTGADYSEQSSDEPTEPTVADVNWTASEYVAHEKSAGWYFITGGAIFGLALLIFLLDSGHGIFSPLIIIVMGITFIVAARRKPQVLDYSVDSSGLHAGSKLYRFSEFKSFSVVREGAIESIVLTPLKRFMPGMTVYFEPKDQPKIVDALSVYLPHETKKQDPIDNLMRKIRF